MSDGKLLLEFEFHPRRDGVYPSYWKCRIPGRSWGGVGKTRAEALRCFEDGSWEELKREFKEEQWEIQFSENQAH